MRVFGHNLQNYNPLQLDTKWTINAQLLVYIKVYVNRLELVFVFHYFATVKFFEHFSNTTL